MAEAFKGNFIRVETVSARLPDGREQDLDVVRHPGGAVAAAVNDSSEVCLLRQYRPVVEEWLWELPAGKLDPGENGLSTARRELLEEAGLEARDWRSLGAITTTPGFCDEILHLFLATDLRQAQQDLDEHEHIEVHWMSVEAALARIEAGRFQDAKSLVALYRVRDMLSPG